MTENLNLNPETHCLYIIIVLKLWFQSLETLNSWFSQFSFIFSPSQVGNCAFWIRHCSRRARRALRAHCHWYFDHWKCKGSKGYNRSATFGTCSHEEEDIPRTVYTSVQAAYGTNFLTVYTFFCVCDSSIATSTGHCHHRQVRPPWTASERSRSQPTRRAR